MKKATKKTTVKKATAKKTATKKVVKKAAVKKTTKKKAVKKDQVHPNYRDVAWTDEKVSVFKALKAYKNGATRPQLAKKSGLTESRVGHFLYHARPEAGDLIKISVQDIDGKNVKHYTLNAAGLKIDPVDELKKKNTK